MTTTLVHIRVHPRDIEAFIEASHANRSASRREPTNLRFDFLQSSEDPSYFILFEAYADKEGAAAHKTTPHYLAWRDTVAPMMALGRRGEPFIALGLD